MKCKKIALKVTVIHFLPLNSVLLAEISLRHFHCRVFLRSHFNSAILNNLLPNFPAKLIVFFDGTEEGFVRIESNPSLVDSETQKSDILKLLTVTIFNSEKISLSCDKENLSI